MVSSVKKSALALGVGVIALLGTAVSANAAPTRLSATEDFVAAACYQPVEPATIYGRVVRLWRCDNSWHAQIEAATKDDAVYLKSAAGTVTYTTYVAAGQSSANTPDVGPYGSPWRACGKAWDRSQEGCTAAN